MREFDVAVVGAGPAGATAARELAAAGVRTALVERAHLPRYKSCAGGIPLRTERILPFSLDSVIEDSVAGIAVSYHGQPRFERLDDRPFAHMVMRDRFDKLLVDEATAAGAELIAGSPVREIERHTGAYTLRLGAGTLVAGLLVGADGANSVVARATGLGTGLTEACALEAEVRSPLAALTRWRGLVNVDLGYSSHGYGWVFPKQHLLSIGLVLPKELAARLRPYLSLYLNHLGLGDVQAERVVGHKVLFRRGHERIAGAGVLLAGDAAGMVDEFTEEGIYYAIRSGEIAARYLQRALSGSYTWLGAYERGIDRELMPELRAARMIARLYYGTLNRAPAAMLLLSRHITYLWRAFFRVQRGDSTYEAEVRRARVVAPLARLLLR